MTFIERLDRTVEAMATAEGAASLRFPAALSRSTLERADYFESFPSTAIEAPSSNGTGQMLAPAACYHWYAALAGTRLSEPVVVTCVCSCARHEPAGYDAGRLRSFTMREVVFAGPGGWVAEQRERWQARLVELARMDGIEVHVEPATDPFFGGSGRGRALLQQLKELKRELRASVADDTLAIGSANLHEQFFGTRFDITLPDGTPAFTGCVAIGLERWEIAAGNAERGTRAPAKRCERGAGGPASEQ
jgi:GNAT superfamily N-acetyltransferase